MRPTILCKRNLLHNAKEAPISEGNRDLLYSLSLPEIQKFLTFDTIPPHPFLHPKIQKFLKFLNSRNLRHLTLTHPTPFSTPSSLTQTGQPQPAQFQQVRGVRGGAIHIYICSIHICIHMSTMLFYIITMHNSSNVHNAFIILLLCIKII